MIPIILDQGLPRSAANLLRHEGWDVLHTGDIGLGRASDAQLIDFARKERRVVITLDSDLHTILAVTNASAPSVIRIRLEGLKGPDLASLIKTIWPKIETHLQRGAMVSVNEAGIRIKRIPVIAS